jgi:hypothetical protein
MYVVTFNPVFLPAILSAIGFLLVCIGLFWAFRRNKRHQEEERKEDAGIRVVRLSVGSDNTRGSSEEYRPSFEEDPVAMVRPEVVVDPQVHT